MKKSTEELNKILKNNKDIHKFISDNKDEFIEESFPEFLSEIIKNKKINGKPMTKAQIIEKAQLPNYGYEIFRGDKNTSRDYILRICFALELSLTETNRVLRVCGHNELYPRNTRDCLIIFAINNGLDLVECDSLLEENNKNNIISQAKEENDSNKCLSK